MDAELLKDIQKALQGQADPNALNEDGTSLMGRLVLSEANREGSRQDRLKLITKLIWVGADPTQGDKALEQALKSGFYQTGARMFNDMLEQPYKGNPVPIVAVWGPRILTSALSRIEVASLWDEKSTLCAWIQNQDDRGRSGGHHLWQEDSLLLNQFETMKNTKPQNKDAKARAALSWGATAAQLWILQKAMLDMGDALDRPDNDGIRVVDLIKLRLESGHTRYQTNDSDASAASAMIKSQIEQMVMEDNTAPALANVRTGPRL